MRRCASSLFLLLACTTHAQHWRALGGGNFSYAEIKTVLGDDDLDRLLVGGSFARMVNANDTIPCAGIAAWNGERWDSLAPRIQSISNNIGCGPIYDIIRFRGRLYASGSYTLSVGDIESAGMARLNEMSMQWEPLECLNSWSGGMEHLLPRAPTDTMYAAGSIGTICGYAPSTVFSYDGHAFYEWPPAAGLPDDPDNYVGFVFPYHGYTYMTGSFRDPLTTGYISLLRTNGNGWEHVPGWESVRPIKDILVHNDTLYLCGYFRAQDGTPGNSVIRFDGTQWNDLGGGLTRSFAPQSAGALRMQWWHNALYVTGDFDRAANSTEVYDLAKWDGHRWCGFPSTVIPEENGIWGLSVWRDSLYVIGGFESIDGVPAHHIAQWIGGDVVENCSSPVGIDESMQRTPSLQILSQGDGTWLVRLPARDQWQVMVHDHLGRLIWRSSVGNDHVQLSLSNASGGIYVVTAIDVAGKRSIGRFVVAR